MMKRWKTLTATTAVATAVVLAFPQAAFANWYAWNMGWGYGEAWGGRGGANDGYWGTLVKDTKLDGDCVRFQMAWSGSGGWRWVGKMSCYPHSARDDAIYTGTRHVYAILCKSNGVSCSARPVLLVDDGT